VVASGLAANPDAKQWDFAKKWLAQVRDKEPGAIRQGLLKQLEANPVQIADLCRNAHREGIAEDAAFYQLAKSQAIDSAQAACDLLGALRWVFERAHEDQNATWDWYLGLAQEVTRGKFGPEVALGFRDLQSRAVRQEIMLQLDLLCTLAERPGQGELDVTDDERADLEEAREAIDLLVKRSGKWSFKGLLIKKVTRDGPTAAEPPL